MWTTTVATCRDAMRQAGGDRRDIVAIGIANQRETTLLWERSTGVRFIARMVWQDRRTADLCARLKAAGHEAVIRGQDRASARSVFFRHQARLAAAKCSRRREQAARGELAFGTVDTFLLWRLTGGKVHATDATNASRTLCSTFTTAAGTTTPETLGVPKSVLPEVLDSSAAFGATDPELFGAEIPIYGIAGDQQAALIGQACFMPGMLKATYGTGCFALLNTGEAGRIEQQAVHDHRLSARRRAQLCARGLDLRRRRRSAMAARRSARRAKRGETGALAEAADPTQEVILVPAFVGLGAPYWRPDARGALFGLTRATGPRELARAALESVCFQTADLA